MSVYVHGLGAVTAFGRSWAESLPALAAGQTAVRPVEAFDVERFPCGVAADIPYPIELETKSRAGHVEIADFDQMPIEHSEDRRLRLAQMAAAQAWAGAPRAEPSEIGVFIGAESGRASLPTIQAVAKAAGGGKRFDHRLFGEAGRGLAQRIDASIVSPAAVASKLAGQIGAEGPAVTISLACASGSSAIAEATRAIRAGRCKVALCGGVGADVDPLMLVGFGRLRALSSKGRSRPFDLRRDGFVVGEGAAMLVLSSEPSDLRLAGVGRSLDAHHLTAPDPEGRGAEAAMRAALREAGRDTVDYVQAHGTSTPLNDAVECRAIGRVLGAPWLSSIKGALGHWIAGAGALGAVAACEALRTGLMLPTAGLSTPDPECSGRHILDEARRDELRSALVNAFAFGGANCSLVLEAA